MLYDLCLLVETMPVKWQPTHIKGRRALLSSYSCTCITVRVCHPGFYYFSISKYMLYTPPVKLYMLFHLHTYTWLFNLLTDKYTSILNSGVIVLKQHLFMPSIVLVTMRYHQLWVHIVEYVLLLKRKNNLLLIVENKRLSNIFET
jgi:hypothetical protein